VRTCEPEHELTGLESDARVALVDELSESSDRRFDVRLGEPLKSDV
jgi:hypothetical protein